MDLEAYVKRKMATGNYASHRMGNKKVRVSNLLPKQTKPVARSLLQSMPVRMLIRQK